MTLTLPQPESEPGPGTICLAGHGTTVTAQDLRMRLVAASDLEKATAIDASELLSVGQAVLQLLIAAKRDAEKHDRRLNYTGASAAFSERVEGCQLANAIGLKTGKDVSL